MSDTPNDPQSGPHQAQLVWRGLSRVQAAAYVGVSPSMFDTLVKEGRMPRPKRIGARTVWDIRKLDAAFDDLPGDEEINEWDENQKA